MTKEIQELFIRLGLTLSTAESCTGGNISHEITSISGSSNYFLGTVVSYANNVKENILYVSPDDLVRFGAVSKVVALQMVKGIIKVINSDYAVSTTGIAGPQGGSSEKPVGTVWIGVGNKFNQEANKYIFSGNREEVIQKATQQAILDLERFVNKSVET